MITSEEVGNIVARLAIHDEGFALAMLQAACDAGDRLLPGDVEKLEAWAKLMRILRESINADASALRTDKE